MNEMVTTAAASTLALLVLYGAGLVFLLQSISERYSAAILAPLLRRASLRWVVPQALIAVLAFALIGVGASQLLKAILAGMLLAAGLVLATVGSYRTWLIVGDRDEIAKSVMKLAEVRRLGAAQEITWNAINRSDLEMAERTLGIFGRDSENQIKLLSWVLGQQPLANRDWLALAICSAIVGEGLDERQAKAIREPLISLLQQVFALEEMAVVYEVVHRTMQALREAAPFTDSHGQLMLDTARSIWRVGDHMGDMARTTRIPQQLEYIKMMYSIRRRDVFFRLLQRKDTAGLTSYVVFLALSLEDTREDPKEVYSLLWDIVADGHTIGILTPEAIQHMANAIGHTKLILRSENGGEVKEWDELWDESWDHWALELARALIDLGADDGDVQHMLGNYRYHREGSKLAAKTRPTGRSEESERRLVRILESRG